MPPNDQTNDPFAGLTVISSQPAEPPELLASPPADIGEAAEPQAPPDPFAGLTVLPPLDEDASFLDNTVSSFQSGRLGELAEQGFGQAAQIILGSQGPIELQESGVGRGTPKVLPDLEPQNLAEDLTLFGTREAPFFATSAGASLLTKAPGAVTRGLGLTRRALVNRRGLKVLERSLKGGTAFGGTAGAGEAIRQRAEGEVDPVEFLKRTGEGFLVGSIAGPVFGPLLEKGKKVLRAKRIGKVRAGKAHKAELEAAVKGAERVSPNDVKIAKQTNRRLEKLTAKLETQIKLSENPDATKVIRDKARLKSLKLSNQRFQLHEDMSEVLNGRAYRALTQARRAFGNAKVRVNGREVPLFEQALNPRGVLLRPDEINQLMLLKDVSKADAGIASTKDIVRILQQMDGSERGFARQSLFDPVAKANTTRLLQTNRVRLGVTETAKRLGISNDKATQKRLFQAAEDRIPFSQLSANEKEFVNFTRKFYNDTLQQINQVSARYGLPEVAPRKNYVTHLQELTFLESMGVKPGSKVSDPALQRSGTSLRFQHARTGNKTQENLLKSIDSYIEPAMRRIHMTKTAAQVQSRAKFLPANARKAVNEWVESAVMGGLDKKDEIILRNGGEAALTLGSKGAALLSQGILGASFRVVAQQPSQIIATGLQAGPKAMVSGLAKAFRNPPKNLFKRSTFLPGRTIADEFIPIGPQAFRTFRKYANTVLEHSDRYVARASWYAGFEKAKRAGFSDEAAVRAADDLARMLHASYQELLKPAALRGRSGKAALNFQTFLFNQWNHVKNDPKVLANTNNSSYAREFFKITGGMLATNQIYQALGLRQPHPIAPPLEASAAGVAEAGLKAVEAVPLVGQIASSLASGQDARLPSATIETAQKLPGAFADAATLAFSEDEDKQERAKKNLSRVAPRLVPFGNQVANTYKGYRALQDGYYNVGNEEIDTDEVNKAALLLLGPTGNARAEDIFRQKSLQRIKNKFGVED